MCAQLCPTLCNPMDCNPPGSSVHGIFQPRVLEQVAISYSRGSSQPRDQTCVSCIAGRSFITESTGKPRTQLFLSKSRSLYFITCLKLQSYLELIFVIKSMNPFYIKEYKAKNIQQDSYESHDIPVLQNEGACDYYN